MDNYPDLVTLGAFEYDSYFLTFLLAVSISYIVLRSRKGVNQRKVAAACAVTILALGVLVLIITIGSNYQMKIRILVLLSGVIYVWFIGVLPKAKKEPGVAVRKNRESGNKEEP